MKERLVKPRILVCTPSNAAVNTIIDGIMRRGFIDNAGKRYNPSILRLGSGTSRDHWSVSLDYIVEVVSKDRHDCQDLKNADAKEEKKESLKQNLHDIGVQIDRLFITVLKGIAFNIQLKRLASQYDTKELQLSKE